MILTSEKSIDRLRFKPSTLNATKQMRYLGCCIDLDGDEINKMKAASRSVQFRTMLAECDGIMEFARSKGYARTELEGLTIKNDKTVGFFSSMYMNVKCKYVVWSGVEYVWVMKDSTLAQGGGPSSSNAKMNSA